VRALSPSPARAKRAASARRWATLLALGWALSTSLGCRQPDPLPPAHQPAAIHARSPDGHDVAGVRVWADGHELGTTDGKGQLATAFESPAGTRIVVTAACPPAYRTLDERREVTVRVLHAAPSQPTLTPLQLTVTCAPLELLAALVVRIRGEAASSMPIRVRDHVVGQTGRDGTAHVVLRARPDASLTVELDTSADPQLEPRNPVRTFQLGKEPSVLVFDQTLTRPRPVRAARRGVRVAGATRGLPYRVE